MQGWGSQNNLCTLNYRLTDVHFVSTKTKLQHFPQNWRNRMSALASRLLHGLSFLSKNSTSKHGCGAKMTLPRGHSLGPSLGCSPPHPLVMALRRKRQFCSWILNLPLQLGSFFLKNTCKAVETDLLLKPHELQWTWSHDLVVEFAPFHCREAGLK